MIAQYSTKRESMCKLDIFEFIKGPTAVYLKCQILTCYILKKFLPPNFNRQTLPETCPEKHI